MTLSDDVLEYLHDLWPSLALAHVNQRTLEALGGRHLRCHFGAPQHRPVWGLLRARLPALRSLTLTFSPGLPPASALPPVALLTAAPNLRTLDLRLRAAPGAAVVCEALAALEACPALQDLRLDLSDSVVGPAGAACLTGLTRAPALRSLRVELRGAELGPGGAVPVARALSLSRTLETLTLGLSDNCLGPMDAAALAELGRSPSLTALHVDLRANRLGVAGAQALAALHAAPALRSLSLDLRFNKLTAAAALALGELGRSAALQALALDLSDNLLGPEGARPLAALADCATLQCVRLGLGDNRLAAVDAQVRARAWAPASRCPCGSRPCLAPCATAASGGTVARVPWCPARTVHSGASLFCGVCPVNPNDTLGYSLSARAPPSLFSRPALHPLPSIFLCILCGCFMYMHCCLMNNT